MAASDNQYFSLKDKRNKAAVDIGCKVWHDSSWLFGSDAISFCIAVDSLFSVLEPGHGTRDSSWEWSWRDKVSLELVSLDESANGDSLTRFCQFGCFLEAWDLKEEYVDPNLKVWVHPWISHTRRNVGSIECASNECCITWSLVLHRKEHKAQVSTMIDAQTMYTALVRCKIDANQF